jgi:hypothetical protein
MAHNVYIYAIRGMWVLKNVAQRNVKPDLHVSVPRHKANLLNCFLIPAWTSALYKHFFGGCVATHCTLSKAWGLSSLSVCCGYRFTQSVRACYLGCVLKLIGYWMCVWVGLGVFTN